MGRLKSVERDGIQTDLRFYDGAGHLLFTGPKTNLPQSYFNLANGEESGGQPLPGTGTETRMNMYDSQGRLLYMRAMKNDGSGNLANKYTVDYRSPGSYDTAGNLKHYVMTDRISGAVNTYDYALTAYEGYKESVIAGTSTKLQPGNTISSYDANGFLTRVDDTTKDLNDRRFVNDASGQVLAVNQNGNILRQLIVNGEVLGRYGVGPDELRPKAANGDPRLVDTADFLFGYRPISPEYPTAAPGSYTVHSGDTLRSIAQTAYGDSRLWYQVADANGLASDADLRVGHTITLPNIVAGASNAAGTFQPYDPSKVVGDTSPNLPAPKPKRSSWFKKLLVVIVMIAVTYFSFNALSGLNQIVAGAISGAAGSVASQTVGVAIGAQDEFSWQNVALSAISGGVTGGVGQFAAGALSGPSLGATVGRAAIGNAITQGIGVVTGLQEKFDWRGVAASAAGTAAGYEVSEALQITSAGEKTAAFRMANPSEQILKSALTGFAAGATAAVMHGGRVSVQQVATDAFGNALGSSIAEGLNGSSNPSSAGYMNKMDRQSDAASALPRITAQQSFRLGEIVEQNTRARADALYGWNTGSDGLGFKPDAGVGTVGMRYAGVRAPMFDDTRVFSDSNDPNTLVNVGQDGRPTAFLPTLLNPLNPLNPLSPLNPLTNGGAAGGGYQPIRPQGAGGSPGYDIVRDMPSGAPGSNQANPSLGLGAPAKPIDDRSWINWSVLPLPMQAMKGFSDYLTLKITGGSDGDSASRLRDPKTGQFVSDPNNPPSPNSFTDADRRASWRSLAQDPSSPLSEAQRAEIRDRGWRGPQRVNEYGEIETMELSHEPVPLRSGGTEVVPRWPADHANVDPYRQLKKRP